MSTIGSLIKRPVNKVLYEMKFGNDHKGIVYFGAIYLSVLILGVLSIFYGVVAYLQHTELPNGYSYIGVALYALALAAYYLFGQIMEVIDADLGDRSKSERRMLHGIAGAMIFFGSIPILYFVIPFMS